MTDSGQCYRRLFVGGNGKSYAMVRRVYEYNEPVLAFAFIVNNDGVVTIFGQKLMFRNELGDPIPRHEFDTAWAETVNLVIDTFVKFCEEDVVPPAQDNI